MPHSNPSPRRDSRPDQVVALLLPELVDCRSERDGLRETFGKAPGEKRLLVCLPDSNSPAEPLLSHLATLAVEKQFLLGHDLQQPHARDVVVQAPPDMLRNDLIEFALALSDVVLISRGNENNSWARHAEHLGKTLVAVGSSFPHISIDPVNVTEHLDPQHPGPHRWGGWLFGRPEQFMLECLAFFSWGDGKKRKNRAWRSFWLWWPKPYFAPDGWKGACPDKARKPLSELIRWFKAMDRSASYGSYLHRDITWIAYFGTAAAVFSAVAGHVFDYSSSWIELSLLTLVLGWVLFAKLTRLQERWTACRLGAEQLRIACMSLPLLVLPPAFATADPERPSDAENPIDFELSALTQAKRTLRQQGLPRADYSALTPADAARWVQLIVADQMRYHENNHVTLERAEKTLSAISTIIFVASIAIIILILRGHDDPRFFLATAAGPAIAAALHGAGTRLGFVHRAALSADMHEQLEKIFHALDEFIKSAASSAKAWQKVRALTYAAAKAMGAENSSWHRLVRRYRDELP